MQEMQVFVPNNANKFIEYTKSQFNEKNTDFNIRFLDEIRKFIISCFKKNNITHIDQLVDILVNQCLHFSYAESAEQFYLQIAIIFNEGNKHSDALNLINKGLNYSEIIIFRQLPIVINSEPQFMGIPALLQKFNQYCKDNDFDNAEIIFTDLSQYFDQFYFNQYIQLIKSVIMYCHKKEKLDAGEKNESIYRQVIRRVLPKTPLFYQAYFYARISFNLRTVAVSDCSAFEYAYRGLTLIENQRNQLAYDLLNYLFCTFIFLEETRLSNQYGQLVNHKSSLWLTCRENLKSCRSRLRIILTANRIPAIDAVKQYINELIKEVLQPLAERVYSVLGEPPSSDMAFALIAGGSFSHGAASPASDLDCALIIQQSRYRHHNYYKKFVRLYDIYLRGLGDPTLLPDKDAAPLTNIGLHIDAGDISKLTDSKCTLINSATGLAGWVLEKVIYENRAFGERELAYGLLNPVLIFSSEAVSISQAQTLLQRYNTDLFELMMTNIDIDKKIPHQDSAEQLLKIQLLYYQRTQRLISKNSRYNIKNDVLKPIVHWLIMIGLYYGFENNNKSLALSLDDILKKLQSTQLFDKNFLVLAANALNTVIKLRCDRYFNFSYSDVDEIPKNSENNHEKQDIATIQHLRVEVLDPLYRNLPYWIDSIGKDISNYDPIKCDINIAVRTYQQSAGSKKDMDKLVQLLREVIVNYKDRAISPPLYRFLYYECPIEFQKVFCDLVIEIEEPARREAILSIVHTIPDEDGMSEYIRTEAIAFHQMVDQVLIDATPITIEQTRAELANYPLVRVQRAKAMQFEDLDVTREFLLAPNVVKTLIDPNTGMFDESKRRQHYGRRIVIDVLVNGNVLFFKSHPELLGIGLTGDDLFARLVGDRWQADILVFKVEHPGDPIIYPVLVSKKLLGMNFQDKLYQQPFYAFDEIDDEHFTRLFLASLLLNFADMKPDSMIGLNRPQLVDTDQIFVTPIVQAYLDGRLAYKLKGMFLKQPKVNIKTFLYCLPHMKHNLSIIAIQDFLKIDVYKLLSSWLLKATKIHNRLMSLFSIELQIRLFNPASSNSCYVPVSFPSTLLSELYNKFSLIQIELNHYLDQYFRYGVHKYDHFWLLRKIMPMVQVFYRDVFENKPTPGERFNMIVEGAYEVVVSKNKKEYVTHTNQALLSIPLPDEKDFQSAVQDYLPPDKHQEILNFHHQSNSEIARIVQHIEDNNHANISHILNDINYASLLELILTNLDLRRVDKRAQEWLLKTIIGKVLIHKISFQYLKLAYCSALTDDLLIAIIMHSSLLIEIDLTGCSGITSEAIFELTSQCQLLKVLRLNNIEQSLSLGDSYKYIRFPKLRRLYCYNSTGIVRLELDAPLLKKLVATKCVFKAVTVYSNELEEVNFDHCSNLEYVYIDSKQNLSVVNLSRCNLSQKSLADLTSKNPKITQLNIEGNSHINEKRFIIDNPSFASTINRARYLWVTALFHYGAGNFEAALACIGFFSRNFTLNIFRFEYVTIALHTFWRLGLCFECMSAIKYFVKNRKSSQKESSLLQLGLNNMKNVDPDTYYLPEFYETRALLVENIDKDPRHNASKPKDSEYSQINEILMMLQDLTYNLKMNHSGDPESDFNILIRHHHYYEILLSHVQANGYNKPADKNITPLHQACLNGDIQVIAYFCSKKIPLDVVDDSGITPLHCTLLSSEKNTLACLSLLLNNGADPNFNPRKKLLTPLARAAYLGLSDCVKVLKEFGADDRCLSAQSSAFVQAVGMKYMDIASYLLEHNFVTNDQLVACFIYNPQFTIDIILNYEPEKKASVFLSRNWHGNTIFLLAAAYSELESISLLVEAGVNINDVNLDGENALCRSLFNQKFEVANYLYNLNLRLSDWQRQVILLVLDLKSAAASLSPELYTYLTEKKDYDEDPDLNAALYFALKHNVNTSYERLIANLNIDVNYRAASGCMPLYWACSNNNEVQINTLLERHADPTQRTVSGEAVYNNITDPKLKKKVKKLSRDAEFVAISLNIIGLITMFSRYCMQYESDVFYPIIIKIIRLSFPHLKENNKRNAFSNSYITSYFFQHKRHSLNNLQLIGRAQSIYSSKIKVIKKLIIEKYPDITITYSLKLLKLTIDFREYDFMNASKIFRDIFSLFTHFSRVDVNHSIMTFDFKHVQALLNIIEILKFNNIELEKSDEIYVYDSDGEIKLSI